MPDEPDKIKLLSQQLAKLSEKQALFQKEINLLYAELETLKKQQEILSKETIIPEKEIIPPAVVQEKKELPPPVLQPQVKTIIPPPQPKKEEPYIYTPPPKSDLEKLIGENILNKIGIAVIVIGVAIGAKFAIENELINPLTRIILGYLAGGILLGLSFRLKKKYENFSAVLLSGAMAILYLITYFAYSLYNLIPLIPAFITMAGLTVFTVGSAIYHQKSVIAHIGLVGAYAVPLLLGGEKGQAAIMFSYMAIINSGILFIAFKKHWKSLYFTSFFISWLIFGGWCVFEAKLLEDFSVAMLFAFLFFGIFYITYLADSFVRKRPLQTGNGVLLILNALIYYGSGYILLYQYFLFENYTGLFTLANASLYVGMGILLRQTRNKDQNIFHLLTGLGILFAIITVPIQLESNWITLSWMGMAVLLFSLGRVKRILFYEIFSFPLLLLAFGSMVKDWILLYHVYDPAFPETRITPVFNIYFLVSLLCIAGFSWISYVSIHTKFRSEGNRNDREKIAGVMIPGLLLIVLYFSGRLEIMNYWHQVYQDALAGNAPNLPEIKPLKRLWVLNYSLLFLSVLSLLNIKKIKSPALAYVSIGLNILAILVFLGQGLYNLSELRAYALYENLTGQQAASLLLGIRYTSLALAGLLIGICIYYIRRNYFTVHLKIPVDLLMSLFILWLASSELLHWMDLIFFAQSYKLVLSILWATYALLMIIAGIIKKKKYLRIGGICLLGITVVKLFFYDIADLDTLVKTAVFVSIGIALLVASFLYNKYWSRISGEKEDTAPKT